MRALRSNPDSANVGLGLELGFRVQRLRQRNAPQAHHCVEAAWEATPCDVRLLQEA